ncbi:MAG: alpha-hydroxy-acid oxidizing protein [Chloroflexi bacterium]|nr:alpha-hydroxy-acid oxidizing protein [Chloroflexota bacterium]MBV9596291.1 alpha-hydroxy-acid oxidizing protein [Chloroflexota bacterium]
MIRDFVTNEELIQEARRRCAQGAWDYLVGGSESETTLRRNRQAFDKIAFRPRVLVDVSNVDTSTELLGQKLRIPAIFAPIGSLQVFDPAGAVAATQAATEFGIMHCVSSATLPALEETADATPTPKIFQLYVHGDDEWTSDMIRRIRDSGYVALALTVDVAHYSRRERPMLSRYSPPTRRLTTTPQRQWLAGLTWETMDQIKAEAGLPFMLKGVQTAEDAEIAVEHGVDYIWVSNHGGRQIDHGLGSMDTLPEIAQAVGGRARIILDGGVQRGSDILKAIALGADVVALGRLQGWSLAAAGSAGAVRMLEILEDELTCAMGLTGLTSIDKVTSKYVCHADPVTPPHEMSSWVNMINPRIL